MARVTSDMAICRMLPIPDVFLWLCGFFLVLDLASAADYCHMELPLDKGDLALRPNDVASIPVHLDLRIKDLVRTVIVGPKSNTCAWLREVCSCC